MAVSAAFQIDAFQQDAFQAATSSRTAASGRGRPLAYRPILDNAIRAGGPMRFRARLRTKPDAFTERRRFTRLTSKTDLAAINSSSYGAQVAYSQSPAVGGGAPALVPSNPNI